MVKIKQGLHLSHKQRMILREKLGEKFGSMEDVAVAMDKSTRGKVVTTKNTQVNATNLRFYLSPYESSPTRPITPSIAKTMYELCGEDSETDFLREYAKLSDIKVDLGLIENEPREEFRDLEDLRKYTLDVHYNGIKSMLDRIYENQQGEKQTKRFFGALEDTINNFSSNAQNEEDQ